MLVIRRPIPNRGDFYDVQKTRFLYSLNATKAQNIQVYLAGSKLPFSH